MSQGKSGMCGPQSRPQHRQHPGSIPACSASPVPQFPHPCWKRLRAPGFILVILEGKQAECASQALSHALPGAGVTPSPAGSSGPAAGPSGCCCRRTPRPPRRPAGPAAAPRSAAAAAAPSRARPGRPRTPAPPASARRLRGPEQGDIGTTRGVSTPTPATPKVRRRPRHPRSPRNCSTARTASVSSTTCEITWHSWVHSSARAATVLAPRHLATLGRKGTRRSRRGHRSEPRQLAARVAAHLVMSGRVTSRPALSASWKL